MWWLQARMCIKYFFIYFSPHIVFIFIQIHIHLWGGGMGLLFHFTQESADRLEQKKTTHGCGFAERSLQTNHKRATYSLN